MALGGAHQRASKRKKHTVETRSFIPRFTLALLGTHLRASKPKKHILETPSLFPRFTLALGEAHLRASKRFQCREGAAETRKHFWHRYQQGFFFTALFCRPRYAKIFVLGVCFSLGSLLYSVCNAEKGPQRPVSAFCIDVKRIFLYSVCFVGLAMLRFLFRVFLLLRGLFCIAFQMQRRDRRDQKGSYRLGRGGRREGTRTLRFFFFPSLLASCVSFCLEAYYVLNTCITQCQGRGRNTPPVSEQAMIFIFYPFSVFFFVFFGSLGFPYDVIM